MVGSRKGRARTVRLFFAAFVKRVGTHRVVYHRGCGIPFWNTETLTWTFSEHRSGVNPAGSASWSGT